MGVSSMPTDGTTPDQLLDAADELSRRRSRPAATSSPWCPYASRFSTRPRASTSSRSSVRRLGTALIGLALAVLVVGLTLIPLTTPLATRELARRFAAAEEAGLPRMRMLEVAEQVRVRRRPRWIDAAHRRRRPSRLRRLGRLPPRRRAQRDLGGAARHRGSGGVAGALAWSGALARANAPCGYVMLSGAIWCAVLVLLAGLAGTLDFDALFSAFHGLFFAEGTWMFPGDSLLIQTFPEQFWATAAGIWAGLILLSRRDSPSERVSCWRPARPLLVKARGLLGRSCVTKGADSVDFRKRGRSSVVPRDSTIEAATPAGCEAVHAIASTRRCCANGC